MRVPTGGIILWYGQLLAIPNGFVLCDGNNGTPDLRDRFVVGAGSTYAVGATGGNTKHFHSFTTNGHNHILPAGSDLASGASYSLTTSTEVDTGTTDNVNHLPPYHALCYIMKT